jgi:hypothetical protein
MVICECGERAEYGRKECFSCIDKAFWDRHTIVTVNGVDMIATRAAEDSPSELL